MTETGVFLRPMIAEEFEAYKAASILDYASEKMKGEGISQEEAERVAVESFKILLPDGIGTANHFICAVIERASQKVIGTLWFGIRGESQGKKAFLYDIGLLPESQGKGYGKQTMLLFEDKVRELGLKSVGLHVFGHNQRARSLYEKLGYRVTNVVMWKEVG